MIGHRREGEVLGRRRRLGFLKRRTESTSVSPCLEIHSVTLGLVERNTLFIPITIRDQSGKTVETPALVDSGAGGKFIDQNFARKSKMDIYNLEKPMKALNVDGTENKRGTIKQYVDLTFTINGRPQTQRLFLTGLGKQRIILGFPWLQEQNPIINWRTGEFRWRTRVPDIKKIRRLTEQRWKNEQEAEELKNEHKELNETPVEETKDSRRVLKRRRNEMNQKTNKTTYISTIIKKCREKLQRRKEKAANIPNDIGNDELESNPKSEYRSAFIEEIDDEEEFKTHTLNPLDKDDFSILIGLMDSMEPEEVWINARTNVATELAVEENKKKEGIPTEKLVPEEYHRYLDIFNEGKANRFPEERSWDHKIKMKEGFEPKSFKNYNLTPEEQLEQDKFLKENLEKGYIRPSQSPMASPFFFVKKKDGKLRPCQDYRYLNDWTIKNAYPLPLISEIMDKLKGAKYFTKLDVRWGYNNVRIKKGDEWKAAFKTNKGLFEPTVMFFGMCNSPATFQGMMDAIFVDMIEGCIVIIYMDNILIFARNQEDLERYTKLVLQRLRENDLFLKALKCEFNKTRIEYLGMIVEEGKISMDPIKLGGIRDWPIPTTVKQTRSFLGFGNFYRQFITHFSDIAQPLNNLMKKDKKFEWKKECQEAFYCLKMKFTEEPVLMIPNHSKPFQIESDASKIVTGAVLTQLDSNGDRHPCAFISKTFSPTERNYEIYDRELLGIIRALEEWRHYIQGSKHTTIIYSDHKNLTYFRTAQKLNRRQARWSLYLSEFDVKLVHMPGTKMIQSDAL